MVRRRPLSLFLLTSCLLVLSNCDKLKIYDDLNSDHFCFRRLNATHETGCHSAGETTGVLHYIRGHDDVSFVLEAGPHPPYVPIVKLANLTTGLLQQFKRYSHRIAGVLILKNSPNAAEYGVSFSKAESFFANDESVPTIYSPETSCPNSKFSLYPESECRTPWVPANAALEMMSYSFPFSMILLTQQNDTNRVVNCFLKFNVEASSSRVSTSWPLCAAEVSSLMHAAVDTPTCMSRSGGNGLDDSALCAPLSSRNIILSTASLDEPLEPVPSNAIFVIARMDSSSMFEGLSPGAYSAVSGILALVSVADTVSRVLSQDYPQLKPKKRIYFALLDGEAFGYIGSSALVWNINETQSFVPLPPTPSNFTSISFANIHSVIELNQVAATKDSKDIWLHTDSQSYKNEITRNLMDSLVKNSPTVQMKKADPSGNLPPSSLMSFLKVDRNLPVVHVTNHQKTYVTPHFNSFLDEASDKWQDEFINQISNVSSALTATLLEYLEIQVASAPKPSEERLRELTDCLLFNSSCASFPKPVATRSQYVSVAVNQDRFRMTTNLHAILSLWTARRAFKNVTADECIPSANTSLNNELIWYDGQCLESYSFFTQALSPAFIQRQWHSSAYSTWSESYWKPTRARIFLLNNPLSGWLTFAFGCILVLGTWLFVGYLQANHSFLFV